MLQGLSAWNVSPIYKLVAFLLRFSSRLAVPRFIEGLCTSLSPVHVISTRFLCRADPPLASRILTFPLCSQWPEQALQTLQTLATRGKVCHEAPCTLQPTALHP
jgi:hypothetical protein